MKITHSEATTNDDTTNDVGVNATMSNPGNSNKSTPLLDVHTHNLNSISLCDSNQSEVGAINEVLKLNAGNLESFPNTIFCII